MTGPADEIAAGQGRWRASHTDREQVVGAVRLSLSGEPARGRIRNQVTDAGLAVQETDAV